MTKISVTRETLDALQKAKEKSTSVRHLQSFTDTMARYHGNLEFYLYAAEQNCPHTGDIGAIQKCREPCSFRTSWCTLYTNRKTIGDHVKLDDATEVRG
jgi:hypothetical protein